MKIEKCVICGKQGRFSEDWNQVECKASCCMDFMAYTVREWNRIMRTVRRRILREAKKEGGK
jgi:hypothetical protein